jgi:hypothetical protein
MYHAEKIINGILHWRGTPDGEWIPYTLEQLTEKLKKALEKISALEDNLDGSV